MRTSESRERKAEVSPWSMLSTFRILAYGFCFLFLLSCAPKHIELPSYENISIDQALLEHRGIKSIEAVLTVDYEKNDSSMSGDAALNLSEDNMTMRIYYRGFLAGEVKENNGVVESKPKLDRNKSTVLVDGLKNSFLWWNIKDYTVDEMENVYVLRNDFRKVVINKKTYLPVKQTIETNDGDELVITYDSPARQNTEGKVSAVEMSDWYQSSLRIEFKKYLVRVKVKSYSVTR